MFGGWTDILCFPLCRCGKFFLQNTEKSPFPPSFPDTELVEVPEKCPKHFFNCLQPKFPPLGGQSKLTLLP